MAEAAARLRIATLPRVDLDAIAAIPIAFEVTMKAEVSEAAPGSFMLGQSRVDPAWIKDYDALPGHGPRRWSEQFDMTNWRHFIAGDDAGTCGSALIAFDTPGLDMLGGRGDMAVIWDLRVAPARRWRGIGAALVAEAEDWAWERGCREIRVETQDINLPACRFYAAQGFRIFAANPGAYETCPDEVQLIWSKLL